MINFKNVYKKYKPKTVISDKNYLMTEEIHLIKNALEMQNIRFKTLVNLRLDTGYRIEEALPIKYKDINRLRGTLKLGRTLIKSKIDGRLIVKEEMKNESSKREIYLTRKVLNLIDHMREFKESCGFIVTDDDYVFTAWDSLELISPERYSAEWNDFIGSLGFSDLPFKNLRDSHASFFADIEDEKNIKAIQKRLGHSRAETTTNIYFQSNLHDDKKLVEKFENEFYNKFGLTTPELYKIVVDRFDRKKKLIDTLQKISGEYVDDSNYNDFLDNFKNELLSLFPIFEKIMKIDKLLDDEEIDAIFHGFTSLYKDVNLENISINKHIKI